MASTSCCENCVKRAAAFLPRLTSPSRYAMRSSLRLAALSVMRPTSRQHLKCIVKGCQRCGNPILRYNYPGKYCSLSLIRYSCAVPAVTVNSPRDLCPGPAGEFAETPPAAEDVLCS